MNSEKQNSEADMLIGEMQELWDNQTRCISRITACPEAAPQGLDADRHVRRPAGLAAGVAVGTGLAALPLALWLVGHRGGDTPLVVAGCVLAAVALAAAVYSLRRRGAGTHILRPRLLQAATFGALALALLAFSAVMPQGYAMAQDHDGRAEAVAAVDNLFAIQ